MQKLLLAFFCRIRYLSLLAEIPEARVFKKNSINIITIYMYRCMFKKNEDDVQFFKLYSVTHYCAGIILLIKSGFHFSKKKSQFDIKATPYTWQILRGPVCVS